MNGKLLIALLITINCCYSICAAALRRTPKVYNALITTDENLTSSRAFPVIQPSIHEGGATHYPFGPYSPYGYYTPPVVRFGQPIVPGLKSQAPSYPLPNGQFPPQFFNQRPGGSPFFYAGMQTPFGHPQFGPAQVPQNLPTEPAQEPSAPQPEKQPQLPKEADPTPTTPNPQVPADANIPQKMNKLPIPLNEFGLPPSLIPLPQYNTRFRNPSGLPPFPYQQFPLAYDTAHGYREQYLPHFGYYPGHNFAGIQGPIQNFPSPVPQQSNSPPEVTLPPPTTTHDMDEDDATDSNDIFVSESTESTAYTTELNFENIKNGSKSKAKNVPDVPPPPIPSGAKSKQR